MTLRQLVVAVLKALRLNRIAHRIYYKHFHGFAPATRSTLVGLERAVEKAVELDLLGRGDFYEFGVFKGYSFWFAQKALTDVGATSMHFYGFDSFEGHPEIMEGPDATADDFYAGQYQCSYEAVYAALDKNGIDWDKTTLVRGFFDESLTPQLIAEHGMRPVAIALVDCDLYASTRDVLRFIEPLLAHQSILIFDDWNCYAKDDDKGQRRAFRELLERRQDISAEPLFEYGSWGAAFLVNSG